MTWFSSCSKCFFQYLSHGGGGGGGVAQCLLHSREEDASEYAQISRQT